MFSNSPSIVCLNGTFLSEDRAFIPITDRGFLFGDGIFTTIKVECGRALCWPLHLNRLEKSCSQIGISLPKEIAPLIKGLIEQNQASQGTWRLKIIVTGGNHSDLTLAQREPGLLLMTLKPYSENIISPCRLTLYPHPIQLSLGQLKTLSYLERLSIADYARKKGVDDALVQDHHGYLLETSFANLFWCIKGCLLTPAADLCLYQGTTIGMVRAAARALRLEFSEVCAFPDEIIPNSLVYLCNSIMGIVSVASIDRQSFERNVSFEKALKEAYRQAVFSNTPPINF